MKLALMLVAAMPVFAQAPVQTQTPSNNVVLDSNGNVVSAPLFRQSAGTISGDDFANRLSALENRVAELEHPKPVTTLLYSEQKTPMPIVGHSVIPDCPSPLRICPEDHGYLTPKENIKLLVAILKVERDALEVTFDPTDESVSELERSTDSLNKLKAGLERQYGGNVTVDKETGIAEWRK